MKIWLRTKKISKGRQSLYLDFYPAIFNPNTGKKTRQTDLNAKIEPIKQAETQRNFLTIEELNSLVKTDCQNPLLKKAALFSALTGLRFSDIQKLVWGELEYIEGNGYFIQFKQQKTKGVEMMPISEQAYSLLGERKEPSVKVFEGLTYSA